MKAKNSHVFAADARPRFGAFVSSDTEIVAVGKTHQRYRIHDGKILKKAKGGGKPIAFAVSNDGQKLAVGTEDQLEIRDALSFASLGKAKPGGPSLAIAFSSDAKLVAARHPERVCVYNAPRLTKLVDYPSDAGLQLRWDILFLKDGRLICATNDGMDLVDAKKGVRESTVEFKPPLMFAGKTFVLKDNRLFVRRDSGIAEYDLDKGRFHREMDSCTSWYCQFVPLLARKTLCTGGIDYGIDLIHLETGKAIRQLKGHAASINWLAASADESRLLSVGDEEDLRLWDIGAAESSKTAYHLTGDETASVDYPGATGLHFSKSGRQLFSAQPGAVQVWSVPDLKELRRISIPDAQGGVQFLSDQEALGAFLVETNETDVVAVLFDLKSGKPKKSMACPIDYVGPAQKTPINRRKSLIVLTAGRGLVKLLSFPKGKILHDFAAHPDKADGVRRKISGVAFSPDETSMLTASGGDNTLKEWNVESGQLRRKLKGRGKCIEGFKHSTNGSLLALCEDHAVKILDAKTWKVVHRVHVSKEIHYPSLAFSPDDSLLAFATAHEKAITLINVKTGKVVATLEGHTAGITRICFSPRGDLFATASHDATLKLWQCPGAS